MKKIQQTKLRKGQVILLWPRKNGTLDLEVIHGACHWEAKKIGNRAIFTITLVKEIPPKAGGNNTKER